MLYTTFEAVGKEYKLRLTAAASQNLEKKLGGKNPMDVVTSLSESRMPLVSDLLTILHASMQKFQSNVTYTDVLDMYDSYVDSGQSYMDLIPVLMEVFKVSGFFPKEKVTE